MKLLQKFVLPYVVIKMQHSDHSTIRELKCKSYSNAITENLLKSEIFSCWKFFQIKPYISTSPSEWSETKSTTGLLYQTQMMDDDECVAVGGMSGKRKPKYLEKTGPSATCPPEIPHDLNRARTRAADVRKPMTNSLSYGTANFTFTIPY
jgi:hypothetical protein